jgi:N-acetylneuraminic acid mutarotase
MGVAAASNGRLYAIGGNTAAGVTTAVEEYNPTTNTWAAKANMPTARRRLGVAAASNGRLYAIGGYANRAWRTGRLWTQ